MQKNGSLLMDTARFSEGVPLDGTDAPTTKTTKGVAGTFFGFSCKTGSERIRCS